MLNENTQQEPAIYNQIRKDLANNDVVLYMKGTKDSPMCGFSGAIVKLLGTLNVEFLGRDVLEDPELREGIKTFTNWPTLPQLYIKGEFIGGCDIIRDLHREGKFVEILKDASISYTGN